MDKIISDSGIKKYKQSYIITDTDKYNDYLIGDETDFKPIDFYLEFLHEGMLNCFAVFIDSEDCFYFNTINEILDFFINKNIKEILLENSDKKIKLNRKNIKKNIKNGFWIINNNTFGENKDEKIEISIHKL